MLNIYQGKDIFFKISNFTLKSLRVLYKEQINAENTECILHSTNWTLKKRWSCNLTYGIKCTILFINPANSIMRNCSSFSH